MNLESWCLTNFHTSGSPGSLHSSANKDFGKLRLVLARPFHPYLISPGCQYTELAWHSPFKTTFISNTKWSRVVKWSLIFLIVDRSVSCWFLVCVLYFTSLICSHLTPVAFTCIEGRGARATLKAMCLE